MPLMTAALVLLAFVMPRATDMYLPAFPQMTGDLHTDASGVQLTLTAFLVGMGLGQLILGPLSDRFGRRSMLLSALAVVLIVFPLIEGHAHHWPLWCFAMLAAGVLVLGVFLRHQQRGKDVVGAVNRAAFTGVLWWVGGAFAVMWALMFFLPKRANSQAD
ncbi:MFS transporter [Streptomyces sp. NPDC053079]|uniref:MFS transporter n=1 Tax=Streptomyces sp. NPDC053079 TaxID=3365697 RepID=UPI0037D2D96A